MTDLTRLTIAEASRRLDKGEIDAEALTEAYLERIGHLDGRLGCYITVCTEEAREQARAAALRAGQGLRKGPLDGIPIAIKDNIDVAGIATTNGVCIPTAWIS